MQKLVLAVVLAMVGIAGCGHDSSDKFDAVSAEMEALGTKLCACADRACADAVQAEINTFRMSLKDKLGKAGKPSEAQTQRGLAAEKQIAKCRAKLSTMSFADVLGRLEEAKSRVCACADKACADKATDEWNDYRLSLKDRLGPDAKPDPEQDKRGNALDVEMKACRERFATPPTP